ncbi:hypothetical protein ACFV4K_10890 [Nocardia sp. NPDC059764]|uniref:hypothetical protein n=1 Tax=Nocardia sp. NPDC059764 TaxID=3346939 RepID=UPI00366982D9
MPTLILPPRYSEDSRVMRAAAISAGWNVLRLSGWRVGEGDVSGPVAFYGEPLLPTPLAVVVDIGLIEGRGWAVVEANSAYGAGVYGCDPRRVLDVLARGCVPRSTLSDNDVHWAASAADFA